MNAMGWRRDRIEAVTHGAGSPGLPHIYCVFVVLFACGTTPKDTDAPGDSSSVDTADTSVDSDSGDTAGESDSGDTSEETAETRCVGSGPWATVSAGAKGSCGVHEDGCIECWTAIDTGAPSPHIDETGYAGLTGYRVPPDGVYSAVELGRCNDYGTHSCAIRQSDGGIDCWGSDAWRRASPPAGEWLALSLEEYDSCALGLDGRIACWGQGIGPGEVASYSLAADYVEVVDCDNSVCGLGMDGRVDCWPLGYSDMVTTIPGPWTTMTIDWHTVVFGVTPAGEVADSSGLNFLPEPSAPAVDLCVAGWRDWGCVLDAKGRVVCNGDLADPPAVSFTSISCGGKHACGVTTAGEIFCWGDCDNGQCDVPVHE